MILIERLLINFEVSRALLSYVLVVVASSGFNTPKSVI